MSDDDSVSVWIERLKAGDDSAAEHLWSRFFVRLLPLACRRLTGAHRRVADEEDAVLSALETVFRRAKQGQFPELKDRDGLWRLLVTVTDRKARNQVRRQATKTSGGGRFSGESVFLVRDPSNSMDGFQAIPSKDPTPEFAALMTESVETLLGILDEELQQIALLKLEGYANEEIAARINRSVPTVERRLRLIRNKWQAEASS